MIFAACKNHIKVRYVRLPDLLNELAVAHGEGTFEKTIKAYQKINLLIIDEFLLTPLASGQARELLEIIEARSVKGSVIFCTQFEPSGWYTRIGNETISITKSKELKKGKADALAFSDRLKLAISSRRKMANLYRP